MVNSNNTDITFALCEFAEADNNLFNTNIVKEEKDFYTKFMDLFWK